MSKAETMYSERERMLTLTQLQTYNLNPLAFFGMIESYIENIHPMPIKWIYKNHVKDKLMDHKADSVGDVELYIYAVGNVSNKFRGNPEKLDLGFARLFCNSYYRYMRPNPVSFQIMDAIEIHLRTPGLSEFEKKNPLRKIVR